MSRQSNLAKNTLIISIGTFLPKLASFITLPILTGFMTDVEYGEYDLVTVMVSLILPTATLQIRAAAFRFLIDYRNDKQGQKQVYSNIMAFTVPICLIVLILFYFVIPLVFQEQIQPTLRIWIILYYFVDTIVNTIRQVARGIGNNMDYAISSIISTVGKMIFAIIMVWYLKTGLLGALISLFAASFFSLVYISIRLKVWQFWDAKSVSIKNFKPMLQYAWPMVPNELSMWVMRVSDRFVVTSFMGLGMNAVYSVANKIPSLITLAQGTLTLAWQENAALSSKDDDVEKYYSEMFSVTFRLQAAFFGLVIATMPVLFPILIKGSYDDAYAQMPILCLGIFFASMATYLGGIYVAYMRSKSVGITTTIAAVINIIVNLALIKYIGLYAASISTLVSYVVLCSYRMYDIQKIVKLKYRFKEIILLSVIIIIEIFLAYQHNLICSLLNAALAVAVLVIFNQGLLRGILKKLKKK